MGTVVLGGGLGGLSAAYYLLKKFPNQSLKIIEAGNRLGGWIKTTLVNDGIMFEQGPRTIRPRGEAGMNTLKLIEELHLEKQLVPISFSSPAAQNRMVYAKGQLHSLPSSVMGLFNKRDLFSKRLITFLLKDLSAVKKQTEDESIYDFVHRRFGSEVADYLISPLICGICAGNAKEISVNFLMKQFFEYEQTYGNIYKGILRNAIKHQLKRNSSGGLIQRASKERWSVYSFEHGLETLTNELANFIAEAKSEIQLNNRCNKITINNDDITLHFDNGQEVTTNNLIASVPAYTLADLLMDQHPELSNILKNIKFVNVGVVNIHYKENIIPEPGFGFLVAPKEKLPILGVIYDSCCFPRGDNHSVLTVMMGGHWFEHYFGKCPTKEHLLETALNQLNNILGVKIKPVQYKINILKKCIPQYKIGHNQNLESIVSYINTRKLPFHICGASYYGVGVNDVILSAKTVVDKI